MTKRSIGLVVMVLASAGQTCAASAAEGIRLQPHRAVYDLTLSKASSGSGMSEMNGRLVYEITGAACEGYTQNMRFVTRASSSDGSEQINDIRTSSFEEATGERLDFSSTHHIDSQIQTTEGRAARTHSARSSGAKPGPAKPGAAAQSGKPQSDNDANAKEKGAKEGSVKVDLVQPEPRQLSLPQTVYFPIQHSLALLGIARNGGQLFVADLYDGSENGDKVSATTTVIGKAGTEDKDDLPANARGAMKGARYWPIATSYFEQTKSLQSQDAVPSHEMSARFYENGVSTKLVLDYGDFALKGELKEITFLPESKCSGK